MKTKQTVGNDENLSGKEKLQRKENCRRELKNDEIVVELGKAPKSKEAEEKGENTRHQDNR